MIRGALRRIGARGIGVQIAAFVVLAVVITNALVFGAGLALGLALGPPLDFDGTVEDLFAYGGRIATVATLVATAPDAARPAVAARAVAEVPGVFAAAADDAQQVVPLSPERARSFEARVIPRLLAARLDGRGLTWWLQPPTQADSRYPGVVVDFSDGLRLRFEHAGADLPRPPHRFGVIAFGVIATIVTIALLLGWTSRAISAPLERLAASVAGGGLDGPPLPQEGTAEVRRLAAALEAMRAAQRAMLAGRTEMLAAVGHDLRTPLTRMRLRAEAIGDPALRADFAGEITRMADLTDKALAFLRGDVFDEPFTRIDAASLIASLVDDLMDARGMAADAGPQVDLELPPRLVVRCRPEILARGVGNLIENALKFAAHRVVVRLAVAGEAVVIAIDDDGPGIAPEAREALLKPFARADAARGDRRGGFGLGLAIARRAAEQHGGRLVLGRASLGGLGCRMELPIVEAAADARAGISP
ncbi:ATP-binding protein [Methylobrevis albus]|uniref:histidine kinase n=1 Tax=Methylobrevis albus TaxID=2793297 RepID=A0A931MX38_9HYPH|nr:ATP-binding protein [Methylobrevis albus]MBH0236230.1 hypothetical protein [Methylobrevis albus]